ncbi:MAG: hypothetical protein L0K86_01045 [Actinomycetia bacterium]|nr:hypothetical protein [Actinomycetes bacterium]
MFQLITAVSRLDLAARQLPVLLVSFAIATVFYHFGNFAFECLAFLATWFVLDAVAGLGLTVRRKLMTRAALTDSESITGAS